MTTTTTKSTAAGRGRQQHGTAQHGTAVAVAAAAGAQRRQWWLRLYGDNEMQHDDATIKQIGQDEMRHIDEVRRDATTRRLDNDDKTDDERRDVAE